MKLHGQARGILTLRSSPSGLPVVRNLHPAPFLQLNPQKNNRGIGEMRSLSSEISSVEKVRGKPKTIHPRVNPWSSGAWINLLKDKPIKNYMRKLIKYIFGFNGPKTEESADETSRRLIDFVLKSVFEVFKDEEFRRYFNFFRQREEEQDRLFNELGVTGLCLLLFALDDIYLKSHDKIHFWREVRQKTPQMFQGWLKELGIHRKHISPWGKLIKMRYQEYQIDRKEVRQELEKHDKEFSAYEGEAAKSAYVRFMAVAIGAIHHLRRGKTNPKDPFFSHLRTWLSILDIQLEKEILRG